MSNLLNSNSGSRGATDDATGNFDAGEKVVKGCVTAVDVLINDDGRLTFALAKASSMFLDIVSSRAAVAHLALHRRPPRRLLLALTHDLRCQSDSLQRFCRLSDICMLVNA
jgi:hypothetical protein